MESTVEAQSLSSLTTIAANPPVQLERFASAPVESVVLYIARVPGSRDVFLTPLKPRKRVVTAEDVQSCLYYFHVNHADDKLLSSPAEEMDKNEESEDQNLRAELTKVRKRKPVGSQRKVIRSDPQMEERIKNNGEMPAIPPRKLIGDNFLPDQQWRNTSVESNITVLSTRRATALNVPSLSRDHLYQSRSFHEENVRPNNGAPTPANLIAETKKSRLQNTRLPSVTTNENRPKNADDIWQNDFSAMQSFDDEVSRIYESALNNAIEDRPKLGHSEDTSSNYDDDLNITMIRRDPASGTQWNVGKIIDPSPMDISLEALHNRYASERGRKTDGPFFLEMYTPGYEKFIPDSEAKQQYNSNTTSQERAWQTSSMQYDETHSRPNEVFKRRLWTESSRLGKIEKVQKRRKNFAFYSPWNGRCEFSTGLDGDSLRCRHSLLRDGLGSPVDDAIVASELRFNLPTIKAANRSNTNNYSNLLTERHSTQNPTHRKFNSLSSIATTGTFRSLGVSSRTDGLDNYNDISPTKEHNDKQAQAGIRNLSQHSQRERHSHQRHHSLHGTQSATAHERLDLSLAQENAGGGFAGRQAKLGKLIIHDEGLKMFDLLVAANMGIWWRAYERMDGSSD